MRKITSKKEEERKNRRSQIIIGGLLILIMGLSTVGYSALHNKNPETEKIVYNGIEFTKEDNLWKTKIGNYEYAFVYNPQEVEEVNVQKRISNYRNAPLYISYEDSSAMFEIYKNLFANGIVERIQEACLEEECKENFPVKNCTDNFIVIKKSDINKVEEKENCVFIYGNEDIAKMSDGFLFKIIGIQ